MAPDGRHEIDINQRWSHNEQIEIFARFCSPHSPKSSFPAWKTNKETHLLRRAHCQIIKSDLISAFVLGEPLNCICIYMCVYVHIKACNAEDSTKRKELFHFKTLLNFLLHTCTGCPQPFPTRSSFLCFSSDVH